ncbi:MAG: TIGR00266 family protein [Bacteroidales bacterium]
MDKNIFPFTIEGSPDYSILTVKIPQGETLKVEAGGMVYMSSNLKLKTKIGGGFKRMLSGESLFISEYSAPDAEGEIGIAPALPGDIAHISLNNETVFLQNSAYLASATTIDVDAKFQGLTKGFFSGEKLFLIKCTGNGDLWFNTYGALLEIEVDGNYVVDTGYIVGFTEGLEYDVQTLGGLRSFFFSGEGLVCKFSGKGKLWIQTRLEPAFVHWANAFRRVVKKDKTN